MFGVTPAAAVLRRENLAFAADMEQLVGPNDLGSLPLVVISRAREVRLDQLDKVVEGVLGVLEMVRSRTRVDTKLRI